MSQEIQPVKKPRGRPRKNPLPLDVNESGDSVATIDDVEVVETVAETEDLQFDYVPTGNEVKDRAIKGAINDCPDLFKAGKYTIPQKDMDVIRNSANPGGECEKYAISKFVKDPAKVIPTLLAVKKLLTRNRDGLTILKAYTAGKECDLKDLINRVNGNNEMVETATNSNEIAIEQVVPHVAQVVEDAPVVEIPVAVVEPSTYSKGQVVTNPADASQTWTIGNRGRKPGWFTVLNVNVAPIVQDAPIVETPVEKVVFSATQVKTVYRKGDVIVNPNDASDTFTVGQRGRQKLWVKEMNITVVTDEVVETVNATESPKVIVDKIVEILTCPDDPSKTYTMHQKGRIPFWVQTILDERQSALKAKLNGTVLTDPEDKNNTYTIGQRGRIAKFALDQMRELGLSI